MTREDVSVNEEVVTDRITQLVNGYKNKTYKINRKENFKRSTPQERIMLFTDDRHAKVLMNRKITTENH